jgi:predicted amidophosphoribosyltransferase
MEPVSVIRKTEYQVGDFNRESIIHNFYCGHCQAKVEKYHKYCWHCGYMLPDNFVKKLGGDTCEIHNSGEPQFLGLLTYGRDAQIIEHIEQR